MYKMLNYSDNNIYESKNEKITRIWADLVLILAVIFCLIMFGFGFILSPRKVVGTSMQPTLNTTGYGHSDLVYILEEYSYTRGQIVVLHKVADTDPDVIKRIIGVAGDTISMKLCNDGYYRFVLNGEVLYEDYIISNQSMNTTYTNFNTMLNNVYNIYDGELTVPDKSVFVCGDNRSGSYDSTSYGCKLTSLIEGRVFIIVPHSDSVFNSVIIW